VICPNQILTNRRFHMGRGKKKPESELKNKSRQKKPKKSLIIADDIDADILTESSEEEESTESSVGNFFFSLLKSWSSWRLSASWSSETETGEPKSRYHLDKFLFVFILWLNLVREIRLE